MNITNTCLSSNRLPHILGILGSLIILVGTFVTALKYGHGSEASYSCFNHLISELGDINKSRWAMLFNASVFTGGLFIMVFVYRLAADIGGRLGLFLGLFGIISGLSGSLVGIFPLNNLLPHLVVAMLFFYSSMCSIGLFSVWMISNSKNWADKVIALWGMIAVICFIAFLWNTIQNKEQILAVIKNSARRPDIWWSAILEWLVFIGFQTWTIVVSVRNLKWPQSPSNPS